jgi:sulfur carrier protein
MTISADINGVPTTLPGGFTVAQLIADRHSGQRWLAVAINGELVPRSLWPDHHIEAGASIEILTAVQGG